MNAILSSAGDAEPDDDALGEEGPGTAGALPVQAEAAIAIARRPTIARGRRLRLRGCLRAVLAAVGLRSLERR